MGHFFHFVGGPFYGIFRHFVCTMSHYFLEYEQNRNCANIVALKVAIKSRIIVSGKVASALVRLIPNFLLLLLNIAAYK